jgi:uncharacterized protein
MEIDQEFVEKMICPACGAKVRLKEDGSGILCTECRRLYPVRDGIVHMLPDKATVEDDQPAPNAG